MDIRVDKRYGKIADICNPRKDGSRFYITIDGKKYVHNDRKHIILSANEMELKYATVQYREDACVKIFRDEIKNSGHYDNYREACRQIAAEYRRVYNETMDAETVETVFYIPLIVKFTIRGKLIEKEVIKMLNNKGMLAFGTTDEVDVKYHTDIVGIKDGKCYAFQIKPSKWRNYARYVKENKENINGMKYFCDNYGLSYYGYIFYTGEDTDTLEFELDINTFMGV